MEKITRQDVTMTTIIHDFYCDECGVHFATSREHDDGHYHEPGSIYLKIYTPRGRYVLDKCLCDQCKEKFMSNIYDTLLSMGFSKDVDDCDDWLGTD